jgi:ferredoxin
VLFSYRLGRASEQMKPPPAAEPQAIFGMHPCDVRALTVFDAVFSAEPYPDQPYLSRRKQTAIVGLGQPDNNAMPARFCERVGVSSMDNAGCDLFLVPLDDDRFLVEVLTEKGAALIEGFRGFGKASARDIERVKKLREEAARAVKDEFFSDAFRSRVEAMFDAPLWDEIGQRCIGCGVCTFLCPTCHCFDIHEETRGDVGVRVRNWDTCQFDLFTRHASGHNPRDTQNRRVRQRVMHKFNYGPKDFGAIFCVGCGRCSVYCPVGIDLREILEALRSGSAKEAPPAT